MNRDLSAPASPEGKVLEFFQHLSDFPFVSQLENSMGISAEDLKMLVSAGDYLPILQALLTPFGLNYEKIPKALIPFHQYGVESRTALEEQMIEAGEYV